MRDAEDVFIVAELPVTRDIDKLAFELFVCIREVANQLFVCWGCNVMVAPASAWNEIIALYVL